MQQISLMSASKQAEVYAAMGGRQELGQRVRAHLFQVKVRSNILRISLNFLCIFC